MMISVNYHQLGSKLKDPKFKSIVYHVGVISFWMFLLIMRVFLFLFFFLILMMKIMRMRERRVVLFEFVLFEMYFDGRLGT